MERALVAAQQAGVPVATPRPGDMVEPAALGAPARWWAPVPWRSAAEAPVRSTGVDHLHRLLPAAGR